LGYGFFGFGHQKYFQAGRMGFSFYDNLIMQYKGLEGDGVPVSEIYHCLKIDLKLAFESLDCLVEVEKHYLLGLIESRMEILYGDAIGVAYPLDPRYLGDGMSAPERKKVVDSLFNYMIQASN
jgi:hypothetical protein